MNYWIILEIPVWTAIVQAIAATIAVPGAIAAFVQLFMRDQQKQEQIDELAQQTKALNNQVDVLGEQLFLTYRPRIKSNGGRFKGSSNQASVFLENHGQPAIIKDIYPIEGNRLRIITAFKNHELYKENSLAVVSQLIENKGLKQIFFKIKICYVDLRGVNYEMIIQFNQGVVEILEDNILEQTE